MTTLHEIISNRFETVFVDVGYYKDYRGLTRQFGYPGYFATPSVMVIEPKQQQLLNMQTMPTWNAAHSVSSEEYLDYFSTIGTAERPEPESLSTEQKERVSQVHNFANQQTARLFEGFKLDFSKTQAEGQTSPIFFCCMGAVKYFYFIGD